MLSRGQQGRPAGTSARPGDASAPGGLSCRAHQAAAKTGHRKPNSDVPDPLGSGIGLAGERLHHRLQAGPEPLCPAGGRSGSALRVPGEDLRNEQSLFEMFSCAGSVPPSQGRGCKAAVGIYSPSGVPGHSAVSACSAAQGISLLCWGSYLMYHQPSKFFLITSTVTPFSKPISSLLWLV